MLYLISPIWRWVRHVDMAAINVDIWSSLTDSNQSEQWSLKLIWRVDHLVAAVTFYHSRHFI
jgi:ABC-type phosphate/phosphonate transport system substrate-binding protein